MLPDPVGGSSGLPFTNWHEFVEEGVPLYNVPDWVPALPPALGGGEGDTHADADTDHVLDDGGYLRSNPLIQTSGMAPGLLFVPAIARAAAASERVRSNPGPVLDKMDSDLHLPFALSKLGEGVQVTPEDKRQEALKWAHSQCHRGIRGTFHRRAGTRSPRVGLPGTRNDRSDGGGGQRWR